MSAEAEWRGQVKEALKNIDNNFITIHSTMKVVEERLRKTEMSVEVINREIGETRDAFQEVKGELSKLRDFIKNNRGGMTGKEKAAIYIALISSISSIIIAIVQVIPK